MFSVLVMKYDQVPEHWYSFRLRRDSAIGICAATIITGVAVAFCISMGALRP